MNALCTYIEREEALFAENVRKSSGLNVKEAGSNEFDLLAIRILTTPLTTFFDTVASSTSSFTGLS